MCPINEEPVSSSAPNPLVSHVTDEARCQDSPRYHSISYNLSNSENSVSVSFQQDQIHNGTSKNELIGFSIPTDGDLPEAVRPTSAEGGINDLAKWHGNIQHIDSITDAFEKTSL